MRGMLIWDNFLSSPMGRHLGIKAIENTVNLNHPTAKLS